MCGLVSGLRALGLVWGLGFRALGFMQQGFWFRVQGFGLHVACRALGFIL